MSSRAAKKASTVRTTVTLDKDVAVAIDSHRRESEVGLSEAVNDLIRAGLTAPRERTPYVPRTHDFGEMKVDVADVEEALDVAEGAWRR